MIKSKPTKSGKISKRPSFIIDKSHNDDLNHSTELQTASAKIRTQAKGVDAPPKPNPQVKTKPATKNLTKTSAVAKEAIVSKSPVVQSLSKASQLIPGTHSSTKTNQSNPSIQSTDQSNHSNNLNPIKISFYGNILRKINHQQSWLFAIKDVVAIDQTKKYEDLHSNDQYSKLLKKMKIEIDNTEYASAIDCLTLIRETKGNYPGPLSRWLIEESFKPAV
jgi:hypothetical protein